MKNSQRCPKWLSILLFSSSILLSHLDQHSTIATDTIIPNLSLSGNQTLISKSGTFELGFFTPTGSQNQYLGIWYKKISPGTVVWVANRAAPLTGNNGVLKLTKRGDLVLLDHNMSSIVWDSKSINSTPNEMQNPEAQLLDNGNFVVKNNNGDNTDGYLWQSFDYPFDTMLPGMKLGWDLRTGLNRFLSAQKSTKDVSPGDYALGIDIKGVAQLVLWKGKEVQYRAGPWNGLRFTGTPQLNSNPIFTFNFTYSLDEVYYSYELCNYSVVTELVVNQSGLIHRLTWNNRNRAWVLFFVLPSDQCDTYNLCGLHSSCNMDNSPICQCLEGFVPKNVGDWSTMDWSGGCVRRTPLQCQEGEGFRKYDRVKLPDTRYAMLNASMSFRECEAECSMNCSCTAYAVADIREDSGCLRWFGDLVDMRKLNDNGQEIYIRMAASDLGYVREDLLGYKVAGVLLLLVLLLLGLAFHIKWKHKKEVKKAIEMKCIPKGGNIEEDPKRDIELPIFDFATIATATSNFTFCNKIGEGGFGPVYKGKLSDGLEIAVKRLSRNSHQGLNEFKNEVILIAKLQHRNLVKLLGCCIQGEEMLLIYEYMSNKSLDLFIFDKIRCLALDWKIRFDIICGIARGLLYLHQDSRLRIIHRDLKASNILLDNNMVPKISDFGMARTFGGDQTETNTRRVVGTYGYMSPEYAMDGLFSVKSDVFSFGVIVLEIISGKKNKGFYNSDHNSNLLGSAWRLWRDGNPLELVDESIANSCILSEVLRCIHVALLCVQHYPDDRPSMPLVSLMLISEATRLPTPKAPGFVRRTLHQTDSSSSFPESVTTNEMTISLLEPR